MMQEGEEVMLKVKLRVRGPLPTQEKVRHSETVNCDQTGARYLCVSPSGASVVSLFQLSVLVFASLARFYENNCALFHQNSRRQTPKQTHTQYLDKHESDAFF